MSITSQFLNFNEPVMYLHVVHGSRDQIDVKIYFFFVTVAEGCFAQNNNIKYIIIIIILYKIIIKYYELQNM